MSHLHSRKAIFCIIMVLFSVIFSCGANGEENTQVNTDGLWNMVEEAYIFSFPLVLMDATMENTTNSVQATGTKSPVNQFVFTNTLSNATFKTVVTPNVDTIYSEAFLDLDRTPLVFVKPMTDRFCSAQVLDAYTNTVAVIGSGGKEERPQDEITCLITGRDYQGDIPEGMIHISVPTDMAWIIVRTVCDGPDDIVNIEALEKQMYLVPLDVYLKEQDYSPESGVYDEKYDFVPENHVFNMSPSEFFNTANLLMESNPPAPADGPILEKMKSINVGPGLSFNVTVLGDDSSERWKQMLNSLNPLLEKESARFVVSYGNWMYYGDPIGDFGTDYAYRTYIALMGLGANPTYVAIYPKITQDFQNKQLSGKNTYKIHFGKGMLPPVLDGGFWSITAYGSDNYLIPNEIDRYSINDRTNLTYNTDGSLDVLLQAQTPDNITQSNWLPVGPDNFHLVMRIYLPDQNMIQGNWTAPEIKKTR